MATDPQTLFSEAACYACYASNPYTLNLLKLALLQQIANNPGGGGGCSVFTCLTDVPNSYVGAGGKEVFVNSAATGLEFVGPYFTKVGTAYIGGDQTGNARGAIALDVQSGRFAATEVASANYGFCFGYGNTASANYATALGLNNTVSGAISVAIGYSNAVPGLHAVAVGWDNSATGSNSVAFGFNSQSLADDAFSFGLNAVASAPRSFAVGLNAICSSEEASAFGYTAKARVENTTNICGPQIIRKDDAEGLALAFYSFCGVNTVLTWPEVDLKSVADYVITLPTGCHFYPDECGVIVTSANTVTVQPTVRFGNSGTPAKFLAAAITTTAAAQFDRQRFQTLLSAAGEVTLSAGVTIVATATTMLGRFYMKGLLVEDE